MPVRLLPNERVYCPIILLNLHLISDPSFTFLFMLFYFLLKFKKQRTELLEAAVLNACGLLFKQVRWVFEDKQNPKPSCYGNRPKSFPFFFFFFNVVSILDY